VKWPLILGSTVVHGGLLLGLGSIEAKSVSSATAISVVENPEPPPKTELPPPPPPEIERAPRARQKAEAQEAPVPETAPTPSLDALPDLGFELGGVAGGAEGFAVRASSGPAPVKTLAPAPRALAPLPKSAADPCQEAPAKPKLISLPKPAYTAAARQGGVEGKVRVRIQVDERGEVVSASILESLGYGLDEAALEAARSARFEAAVRCGKPTAAAFTVAMRFSAG
jgi:TonB family protein